MVSRNRFVAAAAVLAVLALAFWGWESAHRKKAISWETTPVKRGKLVAKVTASGTLSALVTVQVGVQISGRLSEIKVDFNSPVTKGMVLARLDPSLPQADLEQAKANLAAVEGSLEKSKVDAADAGRQLERSKVLFEKQLIAQADLDSAQAKADGAQAQVRASEGQVAQARAALNRAQTNLAYTTITSPINGTVISRTVDVGQSVAATLSAPTLFTIAEDLRKMQVDTSVAEADVGKLKPGMPASFFVDAYPNKKFQGSVRQIRNAATTQQNVVTYDAVIDVENPDLELKPGMTATVTFVYADREDALAVANAALRFHPPADAMGGKGGEKKKKKKNHDAGAAGEVTPRAIAQREDGTRSDAGGAHGDDEPDAADAGNREVWVLDGKKPKPVEIVTGVSDGTFTEVVSGELHEGDLVVTGMSGGSADSGAAQGRGGGMKRMF